MSQALKNIKSDLQKIGIMKTQAQFVSLKEMSLSVAFDVIKNESLDSSSSVATHALGDGRTISDHINLDAESVSINAFFADSSLFCVGFKKMSVKEKIEMIHRMRNEKHLLSYSGPVFSRFYYDAYDVMFTPCVITSINESREVATGSGLAISLKLQKIKTVKSEILTLDKLKYKARPKQKEAAKTELKADEKKAVEEKVNQSLSDRWLFGKAVGGG